MLHHCFTDHNLTAKNRVKENNSDNTAKYDILLLNITTKYSRSHFSAIEYE